HIPRPPNAFMLYRSHMLKSRGNADPEKRQQNLSRIAGQLWRAMSKEDRAVWHKKAAEVQAAHCAKYPGYKFKPNR
ncbi:high mobility group box domain-containing protein, partial [Suillus tomentosus]